MRNLRLSLMLILMMVITPVMAAFGHYAEFAGQLSASTVVAADQMDGMDLSTMDHGDHCQTHKAHQASCTSHVCVGCGITSSYRFFPVHYANSYQRSEKFTLISLAVSPDIKPPITVL